MSGASPLSSLDQFIGRTQARRDVLSARHLQRVAATLGITLADDDAVPPLWHWTLFQEWVPPEELGTDGHPRRGDLIPDVPGLSRRMWAGGRVTFHAQLRADEHVTRLSTIQSVQEKVGSTGRLLLVTLVHEIMGERGLAIREEQDLIYRDEQGAAVRPQPAAVEAPAGAVSRLVAPDSVLLFRYSAITGNGHRIHYDVDYARNVEGYPGLVVHGPLQATWLAGLAMQICPGRRLVGFSYRGQRAVIAGRPLLLQGWHDGASMKLRTLDADGAVGMSAEAAVSATGTAAS